MITQRKTHHERSFVGCLVTRVRMGKGQVFLGFASGCRSLRESPGERNDSGKDSKLFRLRRNEKTQVHGIRRTGTLFLDLE